MVSRFKVIVSNFSSRIGTVLRVPDLFLRFSLIKGMPASPLNRFISLVDHLSIGFWSPAFSPSSVHINGDSACYQEVNADEPAAQEEIPGGRESRG